MIPSILEQGAAKPGRKILSFKGRSGKVYDFGYDKPGDPSDAELRQLANIVAGLDAKEPQPDQLGGGLGTLPAGLSDRQAAFETAKLNAGAKAGTYFKDEAAKRKAKTLNADQTAKVLNDAAASVAGAFTDNPVMDALAKGKKLMAQTLGQGPANLAFGPGEKGLPGHVAGAVGGVASAPFDIGADVVNFASKGEWQAGVNILLKSGALIVPAGKLAGAGLKALSKTKAGIEFNAARGMKALLESGIDPDKARAIVARIESGMPEAPPVAKGAEVVPTVARTPMSTRREPASVPPVDVLAKAKAKPKGGARRGVPTVRESGNGVPNPKSPVDQGESYTPPPRTEVAVKQPASGSTVEDAPSGDKFLTYSEWLDAHGNKKRHTPNQSFGGKDGRGTDPNRSRAIADSKNAKIRDENEKGYADYVKSWEDQGGDLSKLTGSSDYGEDVLKSTVVWVQRTRGDEAAEAVLKKAGWTKGENGKWTPNTPPPRTEGAVKQPWEVTREVAGRTRLPGTPRYRITSVVHDPDAKSVMGVKVEISTDSGWKPYHKTIRPEQAGYASDMVPFGSQGMDATANEIVKRHFGRFIDGARDMHRFSVEQALKEGKPVPAEVLADYPDLAAKHKPEPTPLKTVVLTDPKTGKQQPAHPHEFSDSDLLEILDRKRQSAQTMASQQSFNANGKTLMQDVKALQAEAERRGLRGAGESKPVAVESGKTGGVKTEVMYHGGPAGLTELTLGGKRGHDAGGIFFTPSKEYAEQYSTGGLYEADVPIADIFDSRNPEHLKQLENGFRKMAEDGEYDSVDDALRDYHTIVKMDLRDWATGSQYVDAMEAAGFKGARFQERPGTIGLDGGTFTVSGDPIDSVALFQGPVKVRPHSPTAKPIAGGSSDTGTAPKVPETGAQPPLGSTVEGTFGTSNQAFEASQNIEAPVGKGQSEPSNPSALRQEDTKAFREQEGMDGYEKTTVTDAELMKLARDHNPHAVAAKVLKGEAITADEHTALGVEIQRVRRLMREAKNAGDGDAWIKHYKDAEIFALARDTSASGAARTVRSQRLIMDDAYDHFGLTQRIKEAGGESAVTKHTAETDRMVSDIEAKNAALEKELADARSQIEALLKTKGVPARKAYTPQERRVSALTRLRSLGVPTAEVGEVIGGGMPRGKAGSHTGAIPIPKGMEAKIATELRKLIRSYAGEVNNFNDVMAKLKSDLPGIDEENVHFLLNGKWKEAKLEADIAKRAADKLVRDVKADSVYQAKSLMGKMWHHSFGLLNTTARGLQTTLDDSMALIQGKNVLLWKPGTWVTSVAKGLKAGFTKNPIAAAERSVAKLQNHPLYARAVEAGVEFSDVHGSFNKQEEFFAGRIEEKVPGLSHSKALATVTMNEMRMDLFRKLSRMAPNDPAYLKDIAQQINIATGKGTGKVAKFLGGEIAGNVSYAPRYYLSKWQDNLMVPLFAAKTKGGKIQAGQMYATRAIALGTLIPVAEMFGVKVETDVRSANFGRATLPNGYSFDLFNKMSEGVRTTARLFYGSVSRNGNYKAPDAYGSYSIGDYLESKGSPIVRTFNMVRTGTVYDDETGDRRPAEAKDFWSQYLPLSAKEMVPIGKDINGPDDPKLFLFPLSFLGGDVRGKGPSKEIKTPAPPLKAMPPGLEKMLRGG